MEAFVNVIRKDPKERIKIKDMLDRYMRLPYNYQSKIGYDCLIQKVILKELNNIWGKTIIDLDIELKIKISRINYLEKNIYNCIYSCIIILFYIKDYYICNRK